MAQINDQPLEIIDRLLADNPSLKSCIDEIKRTVEELIKCYSSGGKILICGNGGSAADSEHIVGELMKSFKINRPIDSEFAEEYKRVNGAEIPDWLEGALPAISLVSQTSLSTAFANDESAVGVFAQQVYGYGMPGDIFLGISTSGNSGNVVEAAKVARAKRMLTISLTGARASRLSELSDICIKVPEEETFKVQELHLPVYHAICASVEEAMFKKDIVDV